ncbi:MAG TPA: cell division protein ZapE [Aestuariivirga sp.]|nr:cell division protein ZapE [Aestuariivirga sp.]
MSGLPEAYAEKTGGGELRDDPAQVSVIARLEKLAEALESQERRGVLGKFLKKNGAPRGAYVYGNVGSGKTMLMDLFFAGLRVQRKRRIHFHAFMQDVHKRRQALKDGDVVGQIARDLAQQARVLCLDEMQISDIADAMLVGRLLQALMANGTVIVTTSNLPPDGLYKDGLNRSLFLPAIKLMKENFEVVHLASPTDYRLGRVKSWESFVAPLGAKADAHVQKIWERLTDMPKGEPEELPVLGRSLHVPQAAHGCARFSFAGLCEAPLGSPDYLALAANFQTIFVEKIPALKISQRNEAKRFVLLIDTLYDAKRHLVASSAEAPERIYPQGDHQFEFSRTVSRLQEMQSAAWWGQKIVET